MHHNRRKSGHGHNSSSTTDVRRAVTATDPSARHKRPSMTRRHTPVAAQKQSRSHRDRDRDRDPYDAWDDERESFPQFCMTCEKQFVPHDDKHLYCSESCRRVDQSSTCKSQSQACKSALGNHHPYHTYYTTESLEPRDIIPRASPSRPNSIHFSQSPPESPGTLSTNHHSLALSALRSLTIGPPSPPSPTASNGSGIWPFSRSAATSPAGSYPRPWGACMSSTYDAGHYQYATGAYTHDSGSAGLDRPLPIRHPGASSRPKSIELVTPVLRR
ncbi:uncharacterized protein UV8b_03711 [Ustilaginoidea virens]|uniref:Life-span regulatory factor domain-containing protein n=1 Tax=Ustilaginoidea virens TaxID=1159556 RepID=A0A8E5HQF3_USTVR|nr:uncharacterized protein UV8b_03711 [Ustilaginoidea virens]QUC19470.1 hypothetical protein UV8b_03711 [Ustilaginoidea virens]